MTTAGYLAHFAGSFLLHNRNRAISVQQSSRIECPFVKISGTPIRQLNPIHKPLSCASTGRNGHQGFLSEDGFDHEPFWLSLIKDFAWSLRSLAIFLAEQPSQLKYVEWPTFQSTLKTASLTLALVALLIIALSSIDSALCYILALLLRKSA